MKKRCPILIVCFTIALGGCVAYEPRPLDARADLAKLSSRTVPDAVFIRDAAGGSVAPVPSFDLTDGLREDEAVAVALTLNTDLEAARAAIGESEALLIGARVIPNPHLGVGLLDGISGTPGFTLSVDLLFELLRPGERSARVAAATARSDSTRAEVLVKEYELATAVRRQVLAVLVAEQGSTLLGEEAALRQRAADLLRQRKSVGEGNDLEVSVADLELAEVHREQRLAAAQAKSARLELNRLMGLPPAYDVRLTDSGKPLTVTVFADLTDDQLAERLLAGRLDLRAKEADYRLAEEELRLAVRLQYPRLSLGPSFEHDGVSDNFAGVGASLELPLFDRNQGAIAEKTTARERVRAEYTALLHRLTAEAHAARSRARSAKEEVDAEERDLLPLLKRSQDLSRAALEARELNVLDWVTAQQRALRTRRAFLDSIVAYRQAIIDLDAAIGLSLAQPAPAAQPEPNEPKSEQH